MRVRFRALANNEISIGSQFLTLHETKNYSFLILHKNRGYLLGGFYLQQQKLGPSFLENYFLVWKNQKLK